jgi:hypothetical protein
LLGVSKQLTGGRCVETGHDRREVKRRLVDKWNALIPFSFQLKGIRKSCHVKRHLRNRF